MGKATLVIMAAGIGSRFGGGIKQLEPVGPNGEIIMDYSIYDAMKAGFDKVVFVIRRDLEKDFKEVIGDRISKVIAVDYAYQEVSDIPTEYQKTYKGRTKPWGTGQAILACRELIKEPFLVINADDYYGKEAYVKGYEYLTSVNEQADNLEIGMVGFILGNTLSDNGGVTRGVCKVDKDDLLEDIIETKNIVKVLDGAGVDNNGVIESIDIEAPVSMNMWGLTPKFIKVLEDGFVEFLKELDQEDLTGEYLLPTIIGSLLANQEVEVQVLKSNDEWFGVTYKEDKASVVASIQALITNGEYPSNLF